MATAIAALEAYLRVEPVLVLSVARDGMTFQGQTFSSSSGAYELAEGLRSHGIAELSFVAGVTDDDLLGLLMLLRRDPGEVRAEGGFATLLASMGVDAIRAVDVHLTVVDVPVPLEDQDIDSFLRELASDPDKLAAWFTAASGSDPAAFSEGLLELQSVVGPDGRETLLSTLAEAFVRQESMSRDALLGVALDSGGVRDMVGGMFRYLSSSDIASSVLEGSFGRNMLSLSSALTHLPLDEVTAQVRAEVQAMLPGAGKSTKEASFLEHMLDVRARATPEPALVDSDTTFRAVAAAGQVPEELVTRAREAVIGSGGALQASSVRTMLALLDQHEDFELYCQAADNLARTVPRLIEYGNIPLASRVLSELRQRQALPVAPWPELSARLAESLNRATGPETMGALVRALHSRRIDPRDAREIVRSGGDNGPTVLVMEAIELKGPGLEIAEELLGRRLIDILNSRAARLPWFQLGPVVSRLAREGDVRSMTTCANLLANGDEQTRREVATALAAVGTHETLQPLAKALRDPSTEVSIVAARAIGKSGGNGAGEMLTTRLSELDVDGGDFLLAREIIGGLARVEDPCADATLKKLASRKTLLKRGHFVEVQDLCRQALEARRQRSVVR
jgi:hypothetical protein